MTNNLAAILMQRRAAIAAESEAIDTPVRQHLVDKFRFLIDTGRYSVSNEAIAQAMIEDGALPTLALDNHSHSS